MHCQPSGICVSTEQLSLCTDKADGEDCVFNTIGGKCAGGACLTVSCGNGIMDSGEVCDDGNRFSGDGCSFDCESEETCGNGVVDFVVGEQCDDGNLVGNDGCEADCKLPRCGDHVLNTAAGEECDDGNQTDGDGCSRDCVSNEMCGNNVRDPGEECDDGNRTDHDGCQSNCKVQRCGDGVVDALEQCDDANFDNTDGCLNTCKTPTCGDGFIWAAHEECDDGNHDDTDACPSTCENAKCGDGFTHRGFEDCDDPSQIASGCCHADCTKPSCGDLKVECTEYCDDGNHDCKEHCSEYCPPGGAGVDFNGFQGIQPTDADILGGTITEEFWGDIGGMGGNGYGGAVFDHSTGTKIQLSPENFSDASSSSDLVRQGDSGFIQSSMPHPDFNHYLGTYHDTVNYCSPDGDGVGTISPAVKITVTDACGNTFAETYTTDFIDGNGWPTCQ
jgi:cysteine-rich repeat protein